MDYCFVKDVVALCIGHSGLASCMFLSSHFVCQKKLIKMSTKSQHGDDPCSQPSLVVEKIMHCHSSSQCQPKVLMYSGN